MIEKLPESSGNILGFRIWGKLTESDYGDHLDPAAIQALRTTNTAIVLTAAGAEKIGGGHTLSVCAFTSTMFPEAFTITTASGADSSTTCAPGPPAKRARSSGLPYGDDSAPTHFS